MLMGLTVLTQDEGIRLGVTEGDRRPERDLKAPGLIDVRRDSLPGPADLRVADPGDELVAVMNALERIDKLPVGVMEMCAYVRPMDRDLQRDRDAVDRHIDPSHTKPIEPKVQDMIRGLIFDGDVRLVLLGRHVMLGVRPHRHQRSGHA